VARYIFDENPDPVVLLDELFHGSSRDYKGLPLGNVGNHYRDRLEISYFVLCLFGVVRDFGRFPTPIQVAPVKAAYQDKQTTSEFPAAHRLPCDLQLTPGSAVYDCFQNPFSRTWIQRNVFGRTDRVHRYTNICDSACERGPQGMAHVLAAACQDIANSARTPALVFASTLVPGYANAVQIALTRMDGTLTPLEREELNRKHPVDRFGGPLTPRPTDIRLTSPNAEARAAAKVSVIQVLREYADAGQPPREKLAHAAGQADAMRHNEAPFMG
jgi:hypothetical protein